MRELLAEPTLRAKLVDLIARRRRARPASTNRSRASRRPCASSATSGASCATSSTSPTSTRKQDGVFQAGTLYLDGRALHLCVPVVRRGKHARSPAASDASSSTATSRAKAPTKRRSPPRSPNGDADNVFVGRNGIFYDRDGNDWDATITKIVTNPISVREAFWSPYKKLVKVDRRQRHATRAQRPTRESHAKIDAGGDRDGDTPTQAAAGTPAAHRRGAARARPRRRSISARSPRSASRSAASARWSARCSATMFGLGMWLPLGLVALLLMISGPSMLLAWLKLRRRNLGPILDANGWAINARARINVPFGAAMTDLAAVPLGSIRSLLDPYSEPRRPWRSWLFIAIVASLGLGWYIGRLDKYLPPRVRSTRVLGVNAPASVQPPVTRSPPPRRRPRLRHP